MSVSGVQQSESVVHIHRSTLFQTLSPHGPVQSTEQCPLSSQEVLTACFIHSAVSYWGFPGSTVVKNHLPMQETQETQVWSLGREDPLEWERQRCLEGYSPQGRRVRHAWVTQHACSVSCYFLYMSCIHLLTIYKCINVNISYILLSAIFSPLFSWSLSSSCRKSILTA